MIENHKLNPFGHDNKLWDIFDILFDFCILSFFIMENISILWQQRFCKTFYCFVHILHMKGLFDYKNEPIKYVTTRGKNGMDGFEKFATPNVYILS